MKEFLKKIFVFLMVSSADPRKTSLSVKAAAMGIVPYAMYALQMVCALGMQCIDVSPTLFEQIVNHVTDGIFYALSFASVVGTVYGLMRKLWLTVTGKNLGLAKYK